MKNLIKVFFLLLFSTKLFSQIPKDSLTLWLKADSGVITNGNKVVQWLDLSGKTNHATISNSLKAPSLIQKEINNLPVIRFNGLNETLETKPFQTFTNKRGTILIVAKYFAPSKSNSSGANTYISTYLGENITWQMATSNNLFLYYDGVGSTCAPISEVAENKWEVLTLLRYNDSSFKFFRKGERRVNFTVINNQPSTNKIKIGSNGKLEVLNGDIAEIIIYNKALSENEIKLVNDYLLKKYNISKPIITTSSNTWYYVAFFVIIVLSVLLYLKYVATKKYKRNIENLKRENELNLERNRISREMHDDIGAGLTQISLISQSLKNKLIDKQEVEAITNTSRQLVNSMNEIIWSLNTEYNTLQDLFTYLREFINQLLEYSDLNYSIDFSERNGTLTLSSHQKRNIILIVKEIINNILKHSKATELKVSSYSEAETLFFTISDNGVGFNNNEVKKGNGLKNIHFRIKEINGTYFIDAKPGFGSKFIFTLPLNITT